jgi:ABC-2 type transport system ATP-binding protein
MQTVVELKQARKLFGSVEALRGVDIAISEGEVVAMLGPNGAGKTTSISLMLGLRKPTSGSAQLFGMDPSDRRARSRCGVMLQESGVLGTLKVTEIVDLFRSYYPHPMPTAAAIAYAGLEEKASSQVSKLSGGQRQRLYYALAVCGDPAVVFLDEPTVGMDVEARRAFLDSITYMAAGGKTVVLTTHYLEEADQLAERIIVIDRGLVIADASPREIKSRVAGKRISFRTPEGITEAAFAGLPYSSLSIENASIRILSNQPEDVLREIFNRGLEVADLEVVGADLEEAFLTLTGRNSHVQHAGETAKEIVR